MGTLQNFEPSSAVALGLPLSAPEYFDEAAVRLLAERMKASAGDVVGDFCLATTPGRGKGIQHYPVPNGPNAVADIVAKAREISVEGQNVYFAGALFRSGSIRNNKGRTEANVIILLCAVADFDDEHDPATRHERLPCPPNAEIETSEGNFQCIYWLSRPCSVAEAKPVLSAFTKISGADKCFSADHIWRMPGTWNWLSDAKRAKGRTKVEPATWSEPPTDETITIEELGEALPAQVGALVEGDAFIPDGEFDWSQRTQDRESLPKEQIKNPLNSKATDRSKIIFGLIGRMRDAGYSPEEIATELWTFRRCGDAPVMERYTDEQHWRGDLQRIVTKLTRKTKDGKSLAIIKLAGGERKAVLDACDKALQETDIGVYVQVDHLVEMGEEVIEVRGGEKATATTIKEIGSVRLREILTSAAEFKVPTKGGGLTTIDCPEDTAKGYLARPGTWGVRPLMGTINAPTLRPDGTVLDKPGYDVNTGILYDPKGMAFPPVPEQPTRQDAVDSLAILDELIGLFPFANPESKSVAQAAFLTGIIRRVLPGAPYFGIDAAEAGSGKSLLLDTISMVAGGRKATAINYGPSEEEFDKRLSSALMRGDLCINVDNITRPIEGEQLCTAGTQNPHDFRILGFSKLKKTPTNSLITFSGNNMEVRGDAYRRVLTSAIDPKMERPGERKFPFNPVERATKDRPRYVVACLTIVRAYQVAGSPSQQGVVMGSYEPWTRTVRDALLWLGCADPVQLIEIQSDNDAEKEQFGEFLKLWKVHIGVGVSVTAKEAVEKARTEGHHPLAIMFREVAPTKDGAGIDNGKLAGYLRANKGKPKQGLRIMKGKDDRKNTGTWKLENLRASENAGDAGHAGGV